MVKPRSGCDLLTPGARHPGYPSARHTTVVRLNNLRTIVQPLRGWYFILLYAPGDKLTGLSLSSHSVAFIPHSHAGAPDRAKR